MIYDILIFAFLFLSLVFGAYFIWSMSFAAPYVPSVGKERKALLEEARSILPELKLKNAFEPGAGDANLSFALTKIGYRATAYEMIPFLTLWAKAKKFLTGNKKIEIVNGDFFKTSYEKYDLAIIYLFPALMDKLEPLLFAQMPKGAYILSNTFAFKHKKPVRVSGKVKIYRVD